MQELLTGAAERDIDLGIMITHGAVIKICLLLVEEIETTSEVKKAIQICWEKINPK